MMSSQRSSVATPSKQSILMKINETVRTPTYESRPTPINPTPDMAVRIRATPSLTLSGREGSHREAAAMASPSPDTLERSNRSVVSLPPLTPKRAPVPKSISLTFDMHDAFTEREIDLVNELNLFRKSPQHYAEKMSLFMELHEPFVSHKRMTYPELLQFVSDKTAEKGSLERSLEEMGAKERDEKSALQVRWATEDLERAKKNKKTALAAANKKRGSAVADEQVQIMAERSAILDEIANRYEASRVQATSTLQYVSIELHKASHGAKYVGICLKKVGSSSPLPELSYGRALSLAARDASNLGTAAMGQVSSLARRYGSGGKYGGAQFIGEESASQTVMEMLLSRNDPSFSGRQALLDPAFDSVGSGWRDNKAGLATSTFILSSLFEDLQAISNRPHIPLTQLKHELPNAARETPGTAIGVHSDLGITIVEPRHHPVQCGNVSRMIFRCPEGIQLCGVVSHITDAEPTGPALGDGRSFSHRLDEDTIELLSVLPFRGDFVITLFASKASFSSGYTRIGRVNIASYDWKPVESAITLPMGTGDFSKRNSRLISPINGILPPLSSQTFELVVPFSQYLGDELSVIENELLTIESKHEHSGASLDELEFAAAAAQQHFADVEAQGVRQIQIIDEGIQALAKEAVRKRGKETKAKTVQADLEEQRRVEEQQIAAASAQLGEARARVEAYRRSARQISAQQKRLHSERENLKEAMDRSRPLFVEISVGDRRAVMSPVPNTNNTRYTLSLRVPKSGRVCLYVNGLLQLTWVIGEN